MRDGRNKVRELRSRRHQLVDEDYEARIIGALLADFANARAVTKNLAPHRLGHPHFSAILATIRSIEGSGVTPTIPAVREQLIARQCRAAVSWIAVALDNYLPDADGFRLHLFVGRIIALAELRRLLALEDRVDLILEDPRLDRSSRIEMAYKLLRETLAEFGGEPRKATG